MPSPEATPDFTERLLRRFLLLCENPRTRRRALALVRGSVSNARAGRRFYALVNRVVLSPVARAMGMETSAVRVELVGAQLIGLAMLRYVLEVEPIASLSVDELVPLMAPPLRQALGLLRCRPVLLVPPGAGRRPLVSLWIVVRRLRGPGSTCADGRHPAAAPVALTPAPGPAVHAGDGPRGRPPATGPRADAGRRPRAAVAPGCVRRLDRSRDRRPPCCGGGAAAPATGHRGRPDSGAGCTVSCSRTRCRSTCSRRGARSAARWVGVGVWSGGTWSRSSSARADLAAAHCAGPRPVAAACRCSGHHGRAAAPRHVHAHGAAGRAAPPLRPSRHRPAAGAGRPGRRARSEHGRVGPPVPLARRPPAHPRPRDAGRRRVIGWSASPSGSSAASSAPYSPTRSRPPTSLALEGAGWHVVVLAEQRLLSTDPSIWVRHLEREFHQHLLAQTKAEEAR